MAVEAIWRARIWLPCLGIVGCAKTAPVPLQQQPLQHEAPEAAPALASSVARKVDHDRAASPPSEQDASTLPSPACAEAMKTMSRFACATTTDCARIAKSHLAGCDVQYDVSCELFDPAVARQPGVPECHAAPPDDCDHPYRTDERGRHIFKVSCLYR